MKRRINTKLIREWVEKMGDSGRAKLALEARISVTMVQQLLADCYPQFPRETTRDRLCEALGVSEDELFPPVAAGENEAS